MRLADGGYPPVTGLKARIGGRELFVPARPDRDARARRRAPVGREAEPGHIRAPRRRGAAAARTCSGASSSTSRPTAELVTAHEIELACIDGWWRVVGVDHEPARAAARGAAAPPAREVGDRPFLDWSDWSRSSVTSRASRLRFSHRSSRNLHPAQIADLVEAASHEEGEEIIEAVGAGPRARGRRLRGARRASPARVPARAPRRAGRGGARADGGRRRRRPDGRDRAGAPRADPRAAAAGAAAQDRERCSATTRRPPAG